MENASKALIMAGSVLIALLIIGALLLMFNNVSTYEQSNMQNIKEAQVVEFNNQFTTYIRNDVRGNELYSLLNRVVDYNKRKTIEGDAGAIEIGYSPMKVEFSLKSKDGKKDKRNLTMDGVSRLFPEHGNEFTVGKSTNEFQNDINNKLKEIRGEYTDEVLKNLAIGITEIFLEENATDVEKQEALSNFNHITGQNFTNYNDVLKAKAGVYTYYEYIQFKRAHFDCIDSEYDSNTGRIKSLKFQFNGKIQ